MRSSCTLATIAPTSIALSSGDPTRSVLHARANLVDQLFGHALLHQQSRAGAADLSLIQPDAVDHTFDGAVEIRILEHDEW